MNQPGSGGMIASLRTPEAIGNLLLTTRDGRPVYVRDLAEIGFDGIMTACVFAWEEKADESGRFMRAEMQRYVDKYWGQK